MRLIKSRTSAVVAGATVLALAGGGTAVADRMIGGEDIRNGSIGMRDLNKFTKNQIRGKKIVVPPAQGVQGPAGERGPAGPKGDKGDTGPAGAAGAPGANGSQGPKGTPGAAGQNGKDGADGVTGYEVLNREVRLSNTTDTVIAPCSDGKVALGGGFVLEGIRGGNAKVVASQPAYVAGLATGWSVTASATGEVNVKSWSICASVADIQPEPPK